MDYYERKTKAYKDIREYIEAQVALNRPVCLNDIATTVMSKFGFSKKFVRDYFQALEIRFVEMAK